jgi:hypothetical protein
MTRKAAHARRGRPPKFGRRGRVVAITLPEEVVRGLKRVHRDLAWAIVQLFEKNGRRPAARRSPRSDSELLGVTSTGSLIVVNREVFKALPGVHVVPLHDDRGFLAFDRTASLADLELAIIERLASRSIGVRERQALLQLRAHVRRWRRDRKLRCEARSIIVLERAS